VASNPGPPDDGLACSRSPTSAPLPCPARSACLGVAAETPLPLDPHKAQQGIKGGRVKPDAALMVAIMGGRHGEAVIAGRRELQV